MSRVLIVTVSGMNPSLIGAYGSSTGVTPNLDELATHGILLDQCYLDSFDLKEQLTSLSTGLHALQCSRPIDLWHLLEQSGDHPMFITDAPEAAAWAEEVGCRQVGLIDAPWPDAAAERPIDCASVALFEAAAHELANSDLEGLVWVHSRGLRGPWDAPLELRRQFVDPEDPMPPDDVGPPDFSVTQDTDPDAMVGWSQVAAAQLSILDESLGMLHSVLQARPDASAWHFLVLGLGGVPLGEHGRVGGDRPQCHAEELQCMAILSPATAAPIGWRRSELFQLPDLGTTLRKFCQLPPAQSAWGYDVSEWSVSESPHLWPASLQAAIMHHRGQWWLRVPAWSALWAIDEAAPLIVDEMVDWLAQFQHAAGTVQPRLYVKPDDRWEVSNVTSRCGAVVDMLQGHAAQVLAGLAQNDRRLLTRVEPELAEMLR
jgi:hypothetical protein